MCDTTAHALGMTRERVVGELCMGREQLRIGGGKGITHESHPTPRTRRTSPHHRMRHTVRASPPQDTAAAIRPCISMQYP